VATRQTPGTRAKDSDREDICKILDTALAEGQLSMTEHGERVRSATNAATLGDLRTLVDDLQINNSPVELPKLRTRASMPTQPGIGIKVAFAVVLVLLGMGIGWGLYGNTSSPLSTTPTYVADGIEGKVISQAPLQSLNGMNDLLQSMRKKFGDTMGYRLVVYPDYASMDRADPSDARRQLSYSYRGGWDDPSSSAKDDDDRLVDLAAFNVREVIAVLRGAPETVGIAPDDIENTYVIVEPSSDITAGPQALDVTIYISGEFGSGYVELNGDGSLKRVNKAS
jgi:hypothetical protein